MRPLSIPNRYDQHVVQGRRPGKAVRNAFDGLTLPPDWQRESACASRTDIEWAPLNRAEAVDGKRLCGNCPVRAQCFELGMTPERIKDPCIYGGYTKPERLLINAGKQPKAQPSVSIEVVTRRKEQVLDMHSRGMSKWAIADEIGIDVRSVQRYLRPNAPDAKPRRRLPRTQERLDKVRALMAEGLTAKEIGERMGIAERNVKNYKRLVRIQDEVRAEQAEVLAQEA